MIRLTVLTLAVLGWAHTAVAATTSSPATRPARQLTIYIVPHSHVDVGYTQLQPEIEKKQVNNLLTALDLIDKTRSNPAGSRYRWTVEASWTIDNLVRDHADKLDALKSAAQAGEVELDAAFANLLTGLCRPEELLRAYAWGGRYGKQLGVPVRAAMISDVPGYTWGTVTALASAGVKYFSIAPNFIDRIGTTLLAWEDKPFYWQSPDGRQKALCWVPYKGYSWSHFVKQVNEKAIGEYLDHLDRVGYPYDIAYIRWSGHGDNAVPDAALIDSVKTWNAAHDWPKLKIATVSEPFEALEKKFGDRIPVVSGDWTPYWEDGAGSSALETAMNRATVERLVAAETLSALLRPAKDFPGDGFRSAWRNALLYSEHTWGAHCSISEPQAPLTVGQWEIKRGYAVDADAASRRLLDEVLTAGGPIADAIDVFNVTQWPRSGVVVVAKEISSAGDKVTDEHGQPVMSQRLRTGELAVLASDVPPLGSKRLLIKRGDASHDASGLHADNFALDNGRVHVELDAATGNIRHLSRRGDDNIVDPKSAGLNEYLYVEGNHFDAPKKAQSPQVTVGEFGPLVASMTIRSQFAPGCNKLTRELRLTAMADSVQINDVLDKTRADVKPVSAGGKPQDPNNGKEAVHFAFPFNIPGGEIRMDTPWAVVRPEIDQMPGACKNWFTVQRWVDLSNETDGVTVAPLDTPLVQLGGITATLIGSQTNPAAWLKTADPHAQSLYFWAMNNYWHTNYRAYQEGEVTFRYALRPHARYSAADAQRFGIEQSQPLIVTAARTRSLNQVPIPHIDSPDVVITAYKPANDGGGYILRLFAGAGKDAYVKLRWSGRTPGAVYLSDSLESRGEQVGETIHLPAWGVVTLRVE